MTDRPKLLIIGYGRHGKDTVAEFLRDDYGFKFTSSSLFVAQEVMWDNWGVAKYPDFDAMFEDRSNHRVLWMEMISAYNTPDKTKTAKTMMDRGFDLYVGMRRLDELEACKAAEIFDAIIWVDASERHPPETGSMDITLDNAFPDYVLDNNGPEEALVDEITRLMKWLDSEGLGQWQKRPEGAQPHPWHHMSPVEVLADWLGVDIDELTELEEQLNVPVPVRAAPEMVTAQKALEAMNAVMWFDPLDNVMCVKPLAPPEPEEDEDDPWEPVFIFLSQFPDFEDGGVFGGETDPFGLGGPEVIVNFVTGPEQAERVAQHQFEEAVKPVFKSTRSKVGQLEEHKTTVEGATTIINIENVYMVGGDD